MKNLDFSSNLSLSNRELEKKKRKIKKEEKRNNNGFISKNIVIDKKEVERWKRPSERGRKV